MIGRRSRPRPNTSADSENPYWVSFSDIMAGLLVIFILALVTLMIQQTRKTQELSDAIIDVELSKQQAKEARARATQAEARAIDAEKIAKISQKEAEEAGRLLKIEATKNKNLRTEIVAGVQKLSEIEKIRIEIIYEIAEELKQRGVKVIVSDNSSAFHIPEETLSFETAKWDIPIRNKNGLKLVGDILHNAITKDDRLRFIDTVFVEGHTDSVPLERNMGNWGLSTYRAISVWNFWEQQSSASRNLSQLRNYEGKPAFSVSGYGETRRLIKDDTEEADRRKNRRIDIRFTMKSVEKGDLEKLIDQFSQ